ncbi:MAG TPA: hypothetical protein VF476_17500 [Chitinophagaceae bacterium]
MDMDSKKYIICYPLKKTANMFEEYEKQKKKDVSIMRTIRDYGIGVVVLFFGAFMLLRDQFNLAINERFKPDIWDKVLGVMCLLYGAWRIYRGYKKNYFK